MAGTSLLALIDDIASLLDDVGALTKLAAKETAGVLGDDLALNAEQVSGVRAERELPVVWAVAKGSAFNKLILVPVALALSYWLPWVITPLLMLGGGYLCFEGFEKVLHSVLHSKHDSQHRAEQLAALARPDANLAELEKKKIKGAIRTDFILSAEVVVLTLGTVKDAPFATRAAVVAIMACVLTIGVYVLVAGIVKMDDVGLRLTKSQALSSKKLGHGILWFAPRMLQVLSVVGTIAMFLVGGGIFAHGLPPLAHLLHGAEHAAHGLPHLGSILGAFVPTLLNGLVGIVAGGLLVFAITGAKKLRAA